MMSMKYSKSNNSKRENFYSLYNIMKYKLLYNISMEIGPKIIIIRKRI